jgi:hypothetical protein
MATVKNIFKKTYAEALVKVAGTAAAETISLATDLLATSDVVSGTPTVNIAAVTWTGTAAGVITITRGGVVVMTLNSGASGFLDFGGQIFPPDPTGNTSDIVVTISGGQAECWIRLRKVSGYATTNS